jgi:hypothetical protein
MIQQRFQSLTLLTHLQFHYPPVSAIRLNMILRAIILSVSVEISFAIIAEHII